MLQKPYFAPHQIQSGQYTSGNEFIDESGNDYVGLYHILPTGQHFTESTQTDKSVLLLPKRLDLSESGKVFNRNTDFKTFNYVLPKSYFPQLTANDYAIGYFTRYFVQKKNNPITTIMEIDVDQYSNINNINQVGINGNIYNKCMLNWRIAGPKIDSWNTFSVSIARRTFPYLETFFTNYLEFSK